MPQPTVITDVFQKRAQIYFNSTRHSYMVRVPGVVEKFFQPSITGVLGQKAKPALTAWAAKQSLAYVANRLGEYESSQGAPPFSVNTQEVSSWLAEGAECWNEEKSATTIGTVAHRFAYEELRWRAGLTDHRPKLPITYDPVLMPEFTDKMVDATNSSVLAALDFFDAHHIKPFLLERPVWCPQEGYLGTPDFFGEIDGEFCVLDFKSSKHPYPEYWCQLAALQNAFSVEFPDMPVKRRWIVVIHKDGSGLEAVSRELDERYTQDLNAFRACLNLYNWDRANDEYRKGDPVYVLGDLDKFIPRPNSPAAVAQEPAKRPTAPSSPVTSGAKNLTTEDNNTPWPL